MKDFKVYLPFFLILILLGLAGKAHTLTLEEAIQKALHTHPALKARTQAIKAAEQARKATAANRWLKANFVAQAERHSDPVAVTAIKGPGAFPAFSRDIYFWEIDLSLPLYEGGRVAREVRLKEFETKLEESLWRQSAEDLIANVEQLYYQILYLKALKKTQKELLDLLKRQYQEAQLKYQVGKIARLDLLYFKRSLREEEASLLSTTANLKLAKHLLALLMGQKKALFEVEEELSTEKAHLSFDPEEIETYLDLRPDVKAAAFKVKQAQAALSRAKRTYAPEIAAFSSYGRRAGAGLHHDEEVWVAGLRFQWSLFDSGLRRHQVKERLAQVLSAQENLQAIRLKAREEILSAWTQWQTARRQIEKYQAAADYAKAAFERETVRYQSGAGSITDLLLAQSAWLKARASLLKAYYDLLSAKVSFDLATGQIAKGYLYE